MMKNKDTMKAIIIYVACLFCFVVVISISIFSFVKLDKARKQNAYLNENIKKMEYKNENLKTSVEVMQTNEYVEDEAKDSLGLVKDGEIVYYYN